MLAPLSSVVKDATEGETVVMVAPVRDFASDLTGWIVAALSPQAVPRLLDEVNGTGGLYVPVVADADASLVLSLPGTDTRALLPVLAAVPKGALRSLARVERQGLGAVLAVRTAATDERPGWSTLMLVDEAEANGRLNRLRAGLIALFGLVLGGAAVTAVLSLRQASRPLGDVAASMDRVARGDLSTRVREQYSGELGGLVSTFNTMVEELARSRDELQRTEALRREVEIAHQIQTAILPVSPAVPGFEVAARMKPADDVGGDLYDILAFGDTFWVLVGDVSGHGINSGLVMMMAQAAAYAAIADDPHSTPGSVIAAVNRVVHENVRIRMQRDDYLTLMAARHMGDGRFVAAGAHQPVFIARGGGRVDVIEPAGPWVGLSPNVEPPPMPEYEFTLGKGDLVFFLTDGLLEAKDGGTELFGEDRVKDLLARPDVPSASQALTDVFAAVESFSHEQADDMTGVVLRRKNEPA
jgi:sigma-B regulation protein RsbU (phosphoserine phosphatase)